MPLARYGLLEQPRAERRNASVAGMKLGHDAQTFVQIGVKLAAEVFSPERHLGDAPQLGTEFFHRHSAASGTLDGGSSTRRTLAPLTNSLDSDPKLTRESGSTTRLLDSS